jgi:hypothetical protein
MTRSLVRTVLGSLAVSASAAAILLGAAAPAYAQDQRSATSVPPPMQAMAAPKGSEDMTGSIGFGVGVANSAASILQVAPGNLVALKYWLSDVLAVSPALRFNIFKPATPPGAMTTWDFSPSAVVLFVPFRSTSTRLEVGGGLGISIGKVPGNPDTQVHIFVPLQAGVEHFFTRWFSLGIAVASNLIDYQKDVGFGIHINTTDLLGQLFFYTD